MNREAERKRLVEILKENCHCINEDCEKCSSNGICFTHREADHLLDNGIVVPPYKVGTKVYATIGSLSLPIPYAVYEVTIQRYVLATGGLVPVVKLKKGAVTYGDIHTSLDRLYDTREDALKALRKEDEGK